MHAQSQNGYTVPVKANPGNVIKCLVGGGVMGSKLVHDNEAPFPEKLAEFFIRSFCPPGGTVLDPFCGSGTTLKVALANGRSAIGIDIRKSQIELTKRRIAEVV
jgi:2-polyprenyl-3-methyl-5-hydroxy-6-metoxy-1,4-benzoquinol methylase